MNATIDGERTTPDGKTRVGIRVKDNQDVEHSLELDLDGHIHIHDQEEYSHDASKRSKENNEHANQARRYAKWYVYRERGYDTVPPTENPDRVLATLLALTKLSDAAFDDYFGDLRTHIENKPVGSSTNTDGLTVYKKDIYIQPDPTAFDPPVLDQFLGQFDGDSDSPAVGRRDNIEDQVCGELTFDIKAVSELYTLETDGLGTEQTTAVTNPLDRDPDATVELVPFDPAEIDSLHHYVVSQLAYQIRDYFLRMGVKPPVGFRATGWGKYRAFHEQKFCPQYENYWSAEEDIESWQPS